MLPRKYSQAVMAGESVAGLVVSINRIITKSAIKSERISTISFFGISLGFIIFCVGCHCYIRTSPFVKYHMARCRKNTSQDTNTLSLEDPTRDDGIVSDGVDHEQDELNNRSDDVDFDQEQLISGLVQEIESSRWEKILSKYLIL